jgi:hypothetical protein
MGMATFTGHPLTDPNRLTVSVSQAAELLGIGRSTAFFAAATSGFLMDGVPVLRIATGSKRERLVVSTAHLRAVLGIELPDRAEGSRES